MWLFWVEAKLKGENQNEKEVREEVKKLIKLEDLNCSIDKFSDKVDWDCISIYHKLTEDFVKEFSDKVDWDCISIYQKLSRI